MIGPRRCRGRRAVVVTLALFAVARSVAPARAQVAPGPPGTDGHPPAPAWVGEFATMSANAVLGGLTAGIARAIRGGSFADGFVGGFAGGAAIYAGKRIAAADPPGAGAAGRVVASVGGSIVRNSSEGVGALDRLIVPVGPVRVYVDRHGPVRTRAKVDLNSLVMIGYAVTRDELEFDWGRSLSAGAPVFRAPDRLLGTADDTVRASGRVVENVILLSDLEWRSPGEEREIFSHERIHLLQRDQVFATIAEPAGAAIVRRVPALAGVYRYVDVHFTELALQVMNLPFGDYYDRPSELEAFHLSGQRKGDR